MRFGGARLTEPRGLLGAGPGGSAAEFRVIDQGGQGILHDYAPHLPDVTPNDPVLPGAAPAGAA